MTLRPLSVAQAKLIAAQTGGSPLAVIVVDGNCCAITTWGTTRDECRGLRRWPEREGDGVAASMAPWAALDP